MGLKIMAERKELNQIEGQLNAVGLIPDKKKKLEEREQQLKNEILSYELSGAKEENKMVGLELEKGVKPSKPQYAE